jgi:hypothetical protein
MMSLADLGDLQGGVAPLFPRVASDIQRLVIGRAIASE